LKIYVKDKEINNMNIEEVSIMSDSLQQLSS